MRVCVNSGNRRPPPPPQRRGPWRETRTGPRYHVRDSDGPPHFIISPNLEAVTMDSDEGDENGEENPGEAGQTKEKHAIPSNIDFSPHPRECGIRESPFENLPTEILVQILLKLVKTGTVFHFAPAIERAGYYEGKRTAFYHRKHQQMQTGFYVHQIWRVPWGSDFDPFPRIASLALICRRLRDVAYDLFYGRNQFVLDIAGISLTNHVKRQMADEYLMARTWHWNQSIWREPKNEPRAPLWPLSASILSYITDLAIGINLPSLAIISTAEQKHLQSQLQVIVDCFRDAGGHSLKRFTVSADVARRERGLSVSRQLVTWYHGLSVRVVRHEGLMESTKDERLRLPPAIRRIASPLLEMRGVKEIAVGGVLKGQFEREFRKAAGLNSLQSGQNIRQARDSVGETESKNARLQ